jgi:hypothetical protein
MHTRSGAAGHRTRPFALLWLALVLPLPARAAPPALSVDEVVTRARAVREKRPAQIVCHIEIESELAGKNGEVEHSDKRDGSATLHGADNQIDIVPAHGVHDGKAMSKSELDEEHKKTEQQRKANKSHDMEIVPLASKNAAQQRFTLLRSDTLWGRPVYVLDVKAEPTSNDASLATGTLWIDAETFVELKGVLSPLKLPPHADWIKVQEQFVLGPGATTIPSFLRIEGGGSMMFIRKSFKSTLRWSDCR